MGFGILHPFSLSLNSSFIVNMGQILSCEVNIGLAASGGVMGGLMVGLCVKHIIESFKRSNPRPVGEQVKFDTRDSLADSAQAEAAVARRPPLPADDIDVPDLGQAAPVIDPDEHLYEDISSAPIYENTGFGVRFQQITEGIQLPASARRFSFLREEEREARGDAGGLE